MVYNGSVMKAPTEIAVIGIGNIGRKHALSLARFPEAHLCALCNPTIAKAAEAAESPEVAAHHPLVFSDTRTMYEKARPQAVVIAAPHPLHVALALEAVERGIHVLVEKPLAVTVKQANEFLIGLDRARKRFPGLTAGIVFNQRAAPQWRTIKTYLEENRLGRLIRATWIVTTWFRPQFYYTARPGRGTWAGEGGGVLMNQASHNLDLYQWFFGMPSRVRGVAGFGKYHRIETEDEVTAVFSHDSGMIGHFITSTGESPGTNRLEIAGDEGKLVWEDGTLRFWKNRRPVSDEIRRAQTEFPNPECELIELPTETDTGAYHAVVLENFLRAVRGEEALIAPAEEGIRSVQLANAVVLSSLDETAVDLPFAEGRYEALLGTLIGASTHPHG